MQVLISTANRDRTVSEPRSTKIRRFATNPGLGSPLGIGRRKREVLTLKSDVRPIVRASRDRAVDRASRDRAAPVCTELFRLRAGYCTPGYTPIILYIGGPGAQGWCAILVSFFGSGGFCPMVLYGLLGQLVRLFWTAQSAFAGFRQLV